MSPPGEQDRNWLQALARIGTLGTDLVIFAGLGFWLGQELDERFGWQPWGTFGGTLVGCVVGFGSICRRVTNWDRR